jgi:hypothetical protein
MCGQFPVGKKNLYVADLVGAAMCSAFRCGSQRPLAIMPSRGSAPGQKPAFKEALGAALGRDR